MQIVSLGDNLHRVSNPIFLGKIRKQIKMLSAEFLPSMQSSNIGSDMGRTMFVIPSVIIARIYEYFMDDTISLSNINRKGDLSNRA